MGAVVYCSVFLSFSFTYIRFGLFLVTEAHLLSHFFSCLFFLLYLLYDIPPFVFFSWLWLKKIHLRFFCLL